MFKIFTPSSFVYFFKFFFVNNSNNQRNAFTYTGSRACSQVTPTVVDCPRQRGWRQVRRLGMDTNVQRHTHILTGSPAGGRARPLSQGNNSTRFDAIVFHFRFFFHYQVSTRRMQAEFLPLFPNSNIFVKV